MMFLAATLGNFNMDFGLTEKDIQLLSLGVTPILYHFSTQLQGSGGLFVFLIY